MTQDLEKHANTDVRRNEVEKLAYFLWQNAGEPDGTAERDWLLVEHAVETGPVQKLADLAITNERPSIDHD
jgi:hypothetical protein